jgi:hypothetical protein
VDGLLQVGDLGFFPGPARLDKATKRHAEDDPLELGAQSIAEPTALADAVFADPAGPPRLWFTCGNHEDFDALAGPSAGGDSTSFPAEACLRVQCLRDGAVTTLPCGLRIGSLWGIDARAPNARRKAAPRATIRLRLATQLSGEPFDVLLTHESARDAVWEGSGSEEITALLSLARPAFHFFGHYSGKGRRMGGRLRCNPGLSHGRHGTGRTRRQRGGRQRRRLILHAARNETSWNV